MDDRRQAAIEQLRRDPLDMLVLGGGINGAGVLRDLALRSQEARAALRIGLVEQGHFASGTSSKNSQLIHGGLRYLGNLEFRLVRESLRERSTLLKIAPAFVKPLAFLMPFFSRSERLYYGVGLQLYDWLAGTSGIEPHCVLSRERALAAEPALSGGGIASAALFYDARVNAARFVLANIFEATNLGAVAVNYLRATRWNRQGKLWRVTLSDVLEGGEFEIAARQLVDTTGPWSAAASLRLVRGSHIILPRLTQSEHAIAWFDDTGRIVFVIPWGENGDLSLAGTTDIDHYEGPDRVRISSEEIEYLLGVVHRIFPSAPRSKPIAAYSALRPLLHDASHSATRASREHRIWTSADGIVHVTGGKYTTYRLMSEEAVDLAARQAAPRLKKLHVTATALLAALELPKEQSKRIRFAVEHEMARRLADFLFVSTYQGYEQEWTLASLEPYAREMATLLGWNQARVDEEIESVLCQTALPGRS